MPQRARRRKTLESQILQRVFEADSIQLHFGDLLAPSRKSIIAIIISQLNIHSIANSINSSREIDVTHKCHTLT